jgi:hypothetical protein
MSCCRTGLMRCVGLRLADDGDMRQIPTPVLIVTSLLLISTVLAGLGALPWLVQFISLLGPLLVLWMVLHVLKDTSVEIRDLGEDEHWGYQDRPDLRPVRCAAAPRAATPRRGEGGPGRRSAA